MSTHFQSRRPMFSRVLFCMIPGMFSLAVTASCLGAVVSIGPLPYLSAADSPLLADPTLDVVLEDFEDGLFNVPGVTTEPIDNIYLSFPFEPFVNDGRGIVVGPGPDTDSVDADDGLIDGSGLEGHAFRSTATNLLLSGEIHNFLSFKFQPTRHDGSYPNAIGFVWTDGDPGRFAWVTIELEEIDATGVISRHHFVFPTIEGDSDFNGGTKDDQFVAFYSDTGISGMTIISKFEPISLFQDSSTHQLFFELDHLQLGYTRVPEPSAFLLLWVCIGLCWIAPRQKTLCVFVNIRA